jgi:hypothetical protein
LDDQVEECTTNNKRLHMRGSTQQQNRNNEATIRCCEVRDLESSRSLWLPRQFQSTMRWIEQGSMLDLKLFHQLQLKVPRDCAQSE